ncbi:MAG TPA: malto-oligosyltrehalose trehalohydrolase [Stellaceae bacterium]|nr:malto-oligosyltrehalose trehalohydrolase [Stellaceae bacterium]
MRRQHSMPFGVSLTANGAAFRLWAPAATEVGLRLNTEARDRAMMRKPDGWFDLTLAAAKPGDRYQFVVDGKQPVPDPASRFQPADVKGPSEIIDPAAFDWSDGDWSGRPWHEAVIYELHLGAFTQSGGFSGAQDELERLARLGVTAIELMPIADFAGRRNWGYDGVLPFAPDSAYGRPEALKALICAAHRRGLMVFLDVVYNHFGPEGNYLPLYAPQFFAQAETAWGKALDFLGCARRFFIHNALYWLEEYHVDGLRLDAVHAIGDDSAPHFLVELAEELRAALARPNIHLILENDKNEARYLDRRTDGSTALFDAQWNDDFHHAMHVALTGETEGYYGDYADDPVKRLGRALTQGFAYQGEGSKFRGRARGEPSAHLPPLAFVNFVQNHDQIGNRAFGERLICLTSREALSAAIAILLLAPSPPLLFMGEELGARAPFLFFCDFKGALADAVRNGRRREFAHFRAFASEEARQAIPDPLAFETFALSRIAHSLTNPDPLFAALYGELLALRHREIIPRLAGRHPFSAVDETQDRWLAAHWWLADGSQLSLSANLSDTEIAAPERPTGRVIWQSGTRAGRLAPWDVRWTLAESAAP